MNYDQRRGWTHGDLRHAAERTEAIAVSLLGRTEAEATAVAAEAGIEIAIGVRDGESFPVRAKLDPRRIVLSIRAGRVTGASVG